jgi:hypothetical protein
MQFNLTEAIRALAAVMAAFKIANQARPPAAYLFASLLPEITKYTYQAKGGSMTVRALMAGLVGLDSPYPETGFVEVSDWSAETAKLANQARLGEEALRHLQDALMRMQLANQPTTEFIQREALNLVDKVIVQGHLDTMEYLRGLAICTGEIDWTFNGKRLKVNYGIPAANKLAKRTGNDGYGGSASKFWADHRQIKRLLKGNVRGILAHPDTIDMIRYNPANSLVTIAEGDGSITFRKINAQGQFTQDAGDTVTLISYGLEGEILDPNNPKKTIKIPFCPVGSLTGVGNNSGTRYIVGAGSTQPVENALGYTHLSPTVEAGGQPGRWADVFTPEREPWAIEARGVQNGLPVVEAPEKLVHASSDMA